MNATARLPHASLERDSRLRKAAKIASIVSARKAFAGKQVLEIGTGAGVMAAYFSELVGAEGKVTATDVHDQRQVREGYDFFPVADIELPFQDQSFDIVIYNHVIEHVGDRAAQRHHLAEIRRILKDDGILYIAAPNRWALIEPHFRLAFLSWLPRGLRSSYVRLARRGNQYDCDPLSHAEMTALLAHGGFVCEPCAADAVAAMARFESHRFIVRLAAKLPKALYRRCHCFLATLIFIARKCPR